MFSWTLSKVNVGPKTVPVGQHVEYDHVVQLVVGQPQFLFTSTVDLWTRSEIGGKFDLVISKYRSVMSVGKRADSTI